MTQVTLLYFASLRDAAGTDVETVDTDARDLAVLYAQARARHGFRLEVDQLRVAMDGVLASWQASPGEGAQIAFLPPVSGG